MKHHVVLLIDSIHIPGAFITEDWNATAPDNEIPCISLNEELQGLSLTETREFLAVHSFVKREFCPPANPGSIPCDPELLNEIGGSVSLVEMVLSGAAIISMFFFKANGLPKYGKVFELKTAEE